MNSKIKKLLEGNEKNYIFPFLWMHGEDEKILREYMKVIHDAHIGAVCIESRPHPDFLGEGWWHDMDIIIDEAKKRNMKVWILDDSHFPTGYANGALDNADETLCRQSLTYRVIGRVEEGHIITIDLNEYQQAGSWKPNLNESYTMDMKKVRHYDDDRLEGVIAVKENGEADEDIIDLLPSNQNTQQITFKAPAGVWKIYVINLTRNRGPHRNYINMLNRSSCKILIETVYEAHYRHYKDYFGNIIAGFFSDEPELGNDHLYEYGKRIYQLDDQAYSDEVEKSLHEQWGNNYRKYLPLLWEEEFSPELKAKVRYTYMNVVTKTVEKDFSMQIGDWCRKHHVEYIGHLVEDNNQHMCTGSGLGHYFRGLAGQDMAGIDDIGGQVLPQGEWKGPYGLMAEERNGIFYHFVLGKLADSLAVIDPLKKGKSMCEIFGNYGWEEGVKLESYLVDHFLVRGLNHFVPHAFSPKEFPDPDCPPHFYAHGHNPQYRHFGVLMQYVNRVCELMNGGRHIAPVAILYMAEAQWCGDYMDLDEPAQILAEHLIDYDFLPADVFEDKDYFKTQLGRSLQVNGNIYKMLIVPRAQFLPQAVCKAIRKLSQHGCYVVFLDKYPEGTCEGMELSHEVWKDCVCVEKENLMSLLSELSIADVYASPANSFLRYRRYKDESMGYMFVNEGVRPFEGTIHVPEKGFCYRYNAWFNRIEKISSQEDQLGTNLNVYIEPGKSLIVAFDEHKDKDIKIYDNLAEMKTKHQTDQSAGWLRYTCNSEDYPHFSMAKDVSLPDHLAEEQPEFSGFVRYEKEINFRQVPDHVILEITDASEGVEVFINGNTQGIQITAPYRYDIRQAIHPGKNSVCIEVATTLERSLAKLPDPIRSYLGLGEKQPTSLSGITGQVILKYE